MPELEPYNLLDTETGIVHQSRTSPWALRGEAACRLLLREGSWVLTSMKPVNCLECIDVLV